MTLKIKALIGLYIFSIILFSGVSRAEASFDLFANIQGDLNPVINLENSTGTVFEVDGHLYFETEGEEALLVHSSNFDCFRDLTLPVEVNSSSFIISQRDGFNTAPKTIQFIGYKFETK